MDGSIPAPVMDELVAAIGIENVRTAPTEVDLYRHDASTMSGRAALVCLPTTPEQVRACVEVCARHSVAFVARGSGTGLSGGAVPSEPNVVIVVSRLDEVCSVDEISRRAWVEPGVLNLDLSRWVDQFGLHFAPDPSSQQSCSIGGNVANNSGGPHCLAEGVTSAHVDAIDVVLADGSEVRLGGEDPEPHGLDLRGAFIGSEGMLGIAQRVLVRLTQSPPSVSTMLFDFGTVAAGAHTVSAIIAAGIVPAALEMMDQLCLEAVEAYVHIGLPVEAAAALLVEVDGLEHAVASDTERIVELARAHGARSVRVAADESERAVLWKGRKTAFGAVARLQPDYYLHDTVVPRSKLPEVLEAVYEIVERHQLQVLNVFHAGDGNLHPLILFDRRVEGTLERVHAAGREIVEVSVAAGGVLSGEHGIGLEKRDLMPLMFSARDLAAQELLRDAFDEHRIANPDKVFPSAALCGDVHSIPEGAWI